jgi:F0F1-type ATP synthase epsilon subunit
MKHKTGSPKLTVTARSPFHVYYEGPALIVSATNKVGRFDVLPGHADFFSVMSPGEVVIETETNVVNFSINGGIIGVRNDLVMLFVNM